MSTDWTGKISAYHPSYFMGGFYIQIKPLKSPFSSLADNRPPVATAESKYFFSKIRKVRMLKIPTIFCKSIK